MIALEEAKATASVTEVDVHTRLLLSVIDNIDTMLSGIAIRYMLAIESPGNWGVPSNIIRQLLVSKGINPETEPIYSSDKKTQTADKYTWFVSNDGQAGIVTTERRKMASANTLSTCMKIGNFHVPSDVLSATLGTAAIKRLIDQLADLRAYPSHTMTGGIAGVSIRGKEKAKGTPDDMAMAMFIGLYAMPHLMPTRAGVLKTVPRSLYVVRGMDNVDPLDIAYDAAVRVYWNNIYGRLPSQQKRVRA